MEEKNILSSIIDYLKPKAHDAIDNVTTQWKESQARTNKMMPNKNRIRSLFDDLSDVEF